jgi:GDPmannose 4,6-dehydratase
MMLQQDQPEDFVIATGVQHSVREFVDRAARHVGIELRWEGKGDQEVGIVSDVGLDPQVNIGDVVVAVDPRYYRPTEVETLLGNPAKAKAKLGWEPKITFEELVAEMITKDLADARKDALVRKHGFPVYERQE